MTIDRDGHAIICGSVVRKHGVIILRAACTFPNGCTVPQLSRLMGDQYSESYLYSALKRLCENQGLMTRTDCNVQVLDISLRRVFWKPTDCVREFFLTEGTGPGVT